uniref:ANK_REP_REGION domain-containing protein n=1 Tax=Meloidogyne incognita TaxID=6306 RepID=A0A914MDY6_MELIC
MSSIFCFFVGLDKESAAMLQNKAMIQNNVLAKRKQQLEHWENSEMNQICPRNHYQLSKVKFQNNDIFLSVCQSGDEDEVEELLKKRSDINSSNIDGVTALHQVLNFLILLNLFLRVPFFTFLSSF